MKEIVFYIFPAFIMIVEYFILRSLYFQHNTPYKEYFKMSKSMHVLYWILVFAPVLNMFTVFLIAFLLWDLIVIADYKSDLFWTEEK